MNWMSLACKSLVIGALASLGAAGCARPECARPDYTDAECRVVAENAVARLHTATNVELRFQHPDAESSAGWDALGVLEELEPGLVRARVAALGNFAISLDRGAGAPDTMILQLENIDPRASLTVGPRGREVMLPAAAQPGTLRDVTIDLASDETVWMRGSMACPQRYRVLALGDIQTNPFQFERIVEHLQRQMIAAEAASEPILGLLVLGDLTEHSEDDEFDLVQELLLRLPFPAAVTTGNHDIYRSSRSIYNRRFGPANYAFDLCSARVALFDTGNGALARSVEGRLPDLLDRGDQRFLVAGTHYPAYPGLTGNGWSREDQAHHLLAELAVARADLMLAGHVHALLEFDQISVGGETLREVIVGTAGANQGLDVPRYGYVRMTFGDTLQTCFVEVPPPGSDGVLNDPLSQSLPYCDP